VDADGINMFNKGMAFDAALLVAFDISVLVFDADIDGADESMAPDRKGCCSCCASVF